MHRGKHLIFFFPPRLLLCWFRAYSAFAVCFLDDIPTALAVTDGMVDTGFWVDMYINFNLCLRVEGVLVKDRKVITMAYLKGWFLLDFVSTFPFDTVIKAITGEAGRSMGLLQTIRLLKIAKVGRVLQLSKVAKRLMAHSGLSFGTQTFLALLVKILLLVHLVACGWRLTASLAGDDTVTWLNDQQPANADDDTVNDRRLANADAESVFLVYRQAILFGLKLLKCYTFPTINPTTDSEYAFAVVGNVFCTGRAHLRSSILTF